jgi:RNA polymerase sigma-70 factor (ECF subfamily)
MLNRSARGGELTVYHLLAGIASFHSLASDYAATDWRSILDHYDALVERSRSPLVELNRCVAFAMVHGAGAALDELDRLLATWVLDDYALLYATAGELAELSGDHRRALDSFARARELVTTEPERRLLERKIDRCIPVEWSSAPGDSGTVDGREGS